MPELSLSRGIVPALIPMRVIASAEEMRSACGALRGEGGRLGLVPTMGALHEGHLSLLRAARTRCQVVAASLFVNPLQFGPGEDLSRYPRDFEGDRGKFQAEGVDLLFAPLVEEMYPAGSCTLVTVGGMSGRLCGRSRPGHFRGVTTVVSKLFHIVEPGLAFFGQKDAAQAAIIRRMARDLNLAVEIVVCPIVREPDGLAMSSRNAYLSPAERRSATVLYRALRRVEELARGGERSAAALVAAGREVMAAEAGVRLDYLEVVDPDTLEPLEQAESGALVAVAAFVGATRLIDNVVLPPSPPLPARS
jgi:pantoate--beta-alanine ligase